MDKHLEKIKTAIELSELRKKRLRNIDTNTVLFKFIAELLISIEQKINMI